MLLTSTNERAAQSVLGLQRGGLSRFIPTRLCYSQALLIQSLSQTLICGKKVWTLAITSRNLRPVPCFMLSGLS